MAYGWEGSDDASLFEALKLGAKGYLLKNATPADVAEAVRKVASGESAIPHALQPACFKSFNVSPSNKANFKSFSVNS